MGGGSHGGKTSGRYRTRLKGEVSKGTAFASEFFFSPLHRFLGMMGCIAMWGLNGSLEYFLFYPDNFLCRFLLM